MGTYVLNVENFKIDDLIFLFFYLLFQNITLTILLILNFIFFNMFNLINFNINLNNKKLTKIIFSIKN
jgi:hypothetical protein